MSSRIQPPVYLNRLPRARALPSSLPLRPLTQDPGIRIKPELIALHAGYTHRQLNEEELATAGVTEDMVRLSIGIEHIDDILADIDQALDAAAS